MGSKREPRETASLEEVVISTVMTEEAIINILERKGLFTREEVPQEIKSIRKKTERHIQDKKAVQ
jgi:hypothetical protein